MKINHLTQAYGIEVQKAAGNSKSVSKPERVDKKDSVSVSKQASKLSESVSAEITTQRASALPDVRQEKIADVKQKIADGYYDTQGFRSELADRLIKDMGFKKS